MAEKSTAVANDFLPRFLEAGIWLASMMIYFLWYNAVGELTKLRGVDYTEYFITSLDLKIPPFCVFIIPYVGIYALPVAYLLVVWKSRALDVTLIRRAFSARFVMITLAYLAFYYLPVSIGPIAAPFVAGGAHNIFEHWALQFVHKGMSQFCALPSMHVANVWFDSYVWNTQKLPGGTLIRIFAWLQFPATIGTRAHLLLDLPAGVVMAEVCVRCVYWPLERRQAFATPRSLSTSLLALSLIVPLALYAGLQHLNTITGWGGVANILS